MVAIVAVHTAENVPLKVCPTGADVKLKAAAYEVRSYRGASSSGTVTTPFAGVSTTQAGSVCDAAPAPNGRYGMITAFT